MGKLTKLRVDRERRPGRYGDGHGLWLDVSGAGAKSWLLRYQIRGRIRNMGLGSVSIVGLADARERARKARLLIHDGIDPIDARRQQRAAAASVITFSEAATRVIEAREANVGRESRRQWVTSMAHVRPIIGHLPVAAIDTPLVLQCLEPIWTKKRVTADRIRQRIETVLNWSAARGYREGPNPARWRGHLEHVLSAGTGVKHHPALPYRELPALIRTLRQRGGMAARALEFVVLTP